MTPSGRPPGFIVLQIRPPALSCPNTIRLSCSSGASSALNVSTSFWSELSMTAGLFATAAITHVGPLTENPFSAKAASVPIAAVRFSMKPAPSFSSALARSASKDAFSLRHQRGEFLEQLPGLARRHVAGDEGIGRQVLRRASGAGVSQPRRHPRSRALERERDLVLFRTRRGTLLEEEVLHPDHAGELDRRRVVSGRHRRPPGAHPSPISQPTPRRYRSPMAAANGEPAPCPR